MRMVKINVLAKVRQQQSAHACSYKALPAFLPCCTKSCENLAAHAPERLEGQRPRGEGCHDQRSHPGHQCHPQNDKPQHRYSTQVVQAGPQTCMFLNGRSSSRSTKGWPLMYTTTSSRMLYHSAVACARPTVVTRQRTTCNVTIAIGMASGVPNEDRQESA